MSEWQEYKLEDMTEPVKDGYIPSADDVRPYIGLEHIEQEKLRLNSVGLSSEVTSNKFAFQCGDVLFGKLRPYFRKVYRPKFSGVCSTDIWVFRPKGDFDQSWLFYFLADWGFVDTANGGDGGTRMPRADWNFLKATLWQVPSPAEQKAIAAVLGSLDNKIDLLHRQNATLEALAETLFRQWFVVEAKSEWEGRGLLELVDLVGGGTPKTAVTEYWDGDIPWLSGGDAASNHKSFICYTQKTITDVGLSNTSAKVLPQFATVISARGTVGKYCMLSKEMAFSQSNYGILPRVPNCYFFSYLLVGYAVSELQSSAYGSVFDTITTDTFRSVVLPMPGMQKIMDFERMVSDFFYKKLSSQRQIHSLEKLRDTLLPKLMSGEVRVAV
jgi:type I restriction enzyme S subunit